VGITGPHGFIAGHLARRLACDEQVRIVSCPRKAFDEAAALHRFVSECDVVVHLAGKNRGDAQEVYETNVALAERLALALAACDRPPHVIFASSIHRDSSDSYGHSKKDAQERLRQWAVAAGGSLTILVIPNVFGPGCQPFYNSVVATFCHQLAHGEQPVVKDDRKIDFVSVHDLVEQICHAIDARPEGVEERRIDGAAQLTVSQLLARLENFRAGYFDEQVVPDLSDPLDAALYTTFLSHVEFDDHRHRPQVHRDERGQLVEIIRMAGGGQIFFSTTRPGVIRGNHFHTRKVEWFCVLRGKAVIRIRRVGDDSIHEFRVSGQSPEFISIPPLCSHQIENIGDDDLLTVFWCNEIFQPADPDTYYERVA
jgi:UDP-2-acetamido-2,6-beta-L-arabino-hexul-4-ose reductase